MSPTLTRVNETDRAFALGSSVRSGTGTYYQTTLTRNPLAYWRLSESGVAVDSVGGHDGFHDDNFDDLGVVSVVDGILHGDPDGGYALLHGATVTVPWGSWMDTAEFSFEGIFELTDTMELGAVVSRASIDKFCWALEVTDTSFRMVTVYDTVEVPVSLGQHHFVISATNATLEFYLDGVLRVTTAYSPEVNTGGAFVFGAPLPAYTEDDFPGVIDEFVYYDFRLTPQQVQDDYLLWSLSQTVSTEMPDGEVDRVGQILPRLGGYAPVTYRRALLEDDPWAMWLNHATGSLTQPLSSPYTFSWQNTSTRVVDFGDRGHDGTLSFRGTYPSYNQPGFLDLNLGADTIGSTAFVTDEVENPFLMPPNSAWIESDDYISTSEFTVSAWLRVGPIPSAAMTESIPLLCCAPALDAATFDKVLYLNTAGKLAWRTGVGGSEETIVDPDVFPTDNVPRHVVVSVGPAGTKIRVHGVTKVTGSNTGSSTTAQKVFLFAGGSGFNTVDPSGVMERTVAFQASVFDDQLSDARTDRHNRIGRSYRNTVGFWGADAGGTDRTLPHTSRSSLTGATAQPSIIAAEPLRTTAFSITEPDYGLFLITGSAVSHFLFHVVIRPDTVSGTQRLASFSVYSTATSGTVLASVAEFWTLKIESGSLVWRGSDTGFSVTTPLDTFTHSQGLSAGGTYAIGLRMVGAALELWVNDDKDTFTRSQSGGWAPVTSGNQISYLLVGGTRALGTLPTAYTEMFTGVMDEPYYNILTPRSATAIFTSNYQYPELFWEDLAQGTATPEQSLSTAFETETAFDIDFAMDPVAQSVTIDMVTESDTVETFGLGRVIQTVVESSQVFDFPFSVTVTVQGAGEIVIVSEDVVIVDSELGLFILDPTTVVRAPSSLLVAVSGGIPYADVTFDIDGTDVYTVSLDSDGMLGPTSISVSAVLGTPGTHTLTVTQGAQSESVSFTVLLAPTTFPDVVDPDLPPVDVPAAVVLEGSTPVRHWVLQDLLPEVDGGIGSYIFPHNPRSMTSPHLEHALTVRRSTASDGKNHIFQAGNTPKEWTFTGYCPSQDQQEQITAYRDLNRRCYVIDHHNRAWLVVITNAEFVPRLRQVYNGIPTDWGSDYTITATVVDQEPQIPEEV